MTSIRAVTLLFASFCAACLERDSRLNTDPGIVGSSFCGPVVEFEAYKSVIHATLLTGGETVHASLWVYPDHNVSGGRRRYLAMALKVGDSLCKDSGSVILRQKSHGRWREWEIAP